MKVENSLKDQYKISVRKLVEFVFRSGDLEMSMFSNIDPVDAIYAHQKIQHSRLDNYYPEVTIHHDLELDDFRLHIQGRMDGVYVHPDRTIIDEIKTTHKELKQIEEKQNTIHWAQAKCYAYMYAEEKGLSSIEVQLTYYNLITKKKKEIREPYSFKTLEIFFIDLIKQYTEWLSQVISYQRKRDISIEKMLFPFDRFRLGQREMIKGIYETIGNSDQIFVQAPTGIGKSLAALYPAVKTIGENKVQKIFYLTARTTGRQSAEKALDKLRQKGLVFKSVDITAKKKICFNPDKSCSADECDYAKGHYDRVNKAIEEAFKYDDFNKEKIEDVAVKHQVCPYELSLDLALYADCIICDFNYAFNPRVYLRRFFDEESFNTCFLIDEAHNLIDRSRDMFSATLSKKTIIEIRKEVYGKVPGIYTALGRLNKWFLNKQKEIEVQQPTFAESDPPTEISDVLSKFQKTTIKWLKKNISSPFRKSLIEFYFETINFSRVLDLYDSSYITCFEKSRNNMSLKLFCVDPAVQMKDALYRGTATCFFSATITPIPYFKSVLGCRDHTKALILNSPFPPENKLVNITGGLSTLYKDREGSMLMLIQYLSRFIQNKKGNYFFYFPSYAYMNQAYALFQVSNPKVETILQGQELSEDNRFSFIAKFKEKRNETLVGFAVMGGIFAESIDLVGEHLSGAVVVGVGLPGMSLERKVIKQYYDDKCDCGFEYAYMYPGFNKVLQAVGRVIRTEKDVGTILLIDQRYIQNRYQDLFPEDWEPEIIYNPEKLNQYLAEFWERNANLA